MAHVVAGHAKARMSQATTLPMAQRVAIIGGGYAGMAAALILVERGVHVTVFEAAQTLGGRARSVVWQSHALDNGQHILLGAYHRLLAWVRTLHTELPLDRLPLRWERLGESRMLAPAGRGQWPLAWAWLTAKGWPWSERWAFLRTLLGVKLGRMPDPALTVAMWLKDAPPGLMARFWAPLTLAALNTPVEQASARVLANVVKDGLLAGAEAASMWLPTVDLSQLFPVPAAKRIQNFGAYVLMGKTVTVEVGEDNAVWVDGEIFDAVIVATSPHRLTSALPAAPFANTLATVAALRYQPIETIYLQYPEATRLPEPMLGLPEGIGQWVFDRGQLGFAPGQMAVVVSAESAYTHAAGEELAAAVVAQLAGYFPAWPAPVWAKTLREARATFSCDAGLIRPNHTTEHPRVWLAGDYTAGPYPATLEGAIRSGEAAAAAVCEAILPARRV